MFYPWTLAEQRIFQPGNFRHNNNLNNKGLRKMKDSKWNEFRGSAAVEAIKQAKATGGDLAQLEAEIMWKSEAVRSEFNNDREAMTAFLSNEGMVSEHKSKYESFPAESFPPDAPPEDDSIDFENPPAPEPAPQPAVKTYKQSDFEQDAPVDLAGEAKKESKILQNAGIYQEEWKNDAEAQREFGGDLEAYIFFRANQHRVQFLNK